jgi:DNA-binding transcriptional MocR family regulator
MATLSKEYLKLKISIAQQGGITLVDQVVDRLSNLIQTRTLGPGKKLASIRQFAAENGISKATVVEAYDRLAATGLITSRPKAGFYVAARLQPAEARKHPEASREREIDPLWMLRHSLRLDAGILRPGCGWLPSSLLPGEGIRRGLRAVARTHDVSLTDYGSPLGYPPLRDHLRRILAARGIETDAGRILLTDSGSQAIELAIQLVVQPGDTVLVDDPCYFNFQAILGFHRVTVIGIPFLNNGPDLTALAAAAARHRPRLYISNATLQNPTGATLTPAVAHKLLKIAERYDFAILEDDTFADFEESPSTRLAALDELQRVIYVGSFSKTLSGATRCGYMTGQPEWIEGLIDLKLAKSFGNNEVASRLIHQLLIDGSYRKHMEAIRSHLRQVSVHVRHQIRNCGLDLWHEPEGGFFLWAMADPDVDTAAIARRAIGQDILLAPGNVFSVSRSAGRFLRFNVAQSREPRIFEFLRQALEMASRG